MAYTIFTDAGKTIAREYLLAYLNTGTDSTPVWSLIGKRVEGSEESIDWSMEQHSDIIGESYTTAKKAKISQEFSPVLLDGGVAAYNKIWEIAIRDQDAQALCNQDCLIVHKYANDGQTTPKLFAERYKSCAIDVTALGGDGGAEISMPFTVNYGGERILGGATISSGTVTFTPDA
jgi:hypothetical protein